MQKIQYLQNRFKDLPKQGSTKWLANRSTQFGGSEIATLLGKNKYKTVKQLLEDKQTPQKNNSLPCLWGHIFETVAKDKLKHDEHEIYEFGSIPHSTLPLAYSPDGVILKDNELILLEIKCPIMRGVSSIPPMYLCQIQTGLNILPCQKCMFIQFKYRHCSLKQLENTNKYNRWFHKESYKRSPESDCKYYGFLWWDRPHLINEISPKQMKYGFKLYVNYKHDIQKEIEKKTHGDIMAFKCFDQTIEWIHKNPTFIDSIEETIWNTYFSLTTKDETK